MHVFASTLPSYTDTVFIDDLTVQWNAGGDCKIDYTLHIQGVFDSVDTRSSVKLSNLPPSAQNRHADNHVAIHQEIPMHLCVTHAMYIGP